MEDKIRLLDAEVGKTYTIKEINTWSQKRKRAASSSSRTADTISISCCQTPFWCKLTALDLIGPKKGSDLSRRIT